MVTPVYNASASWWIFSSIMAGIAALFRFVWRFFTGAHMDGKPRTDARWFAFGSRSLIETDSPSWWCYKPRSLRMLLRWISFVLFVFSSGVIIAMVTVGDPAKLLRFALSTGAISGVVWLYYRYKTRENRRIRRFYVEPLGLHLAPYMGWAKEAPVTKWLSISKDLEGLDPPPSRKMRKIERMAREWYGLKVEPVVRWLPNQVIRLRDLATDKIQIGGEKEEKNNYLRRLWELFAIDEEPPPPRIEVRAARHHHISKECKHMATDLVSSKLSAKNLQVTWNQLGEYEVGVFTTVKAPPSKVGFEDMKREIAKGIIPDHKYFVGYDSEKKPVYLDFEMDSPHIAVSAGTGAGKSVFAMIIAIQILRNGGRVVIIDRKGSHLWAKDLPGVTYCRKVEDMHNTLIDVSAIADRRNDQAFDMADPDSDEENETENGWPRYFVIFEEMNATIAQLKTYWNKTREKDEEKTSPAIQGFRDIMYMGRSAKVHLFGVAQMLSAQSTGGPEARENFGIRCLARYSANNWKMLAPETRMPRPSKIRGRWQIVVAGEATEIQAAYVSTSEARLLARESSVKPFVPQSRVSETTGFVQGSLATSGAVEGGSGQGAGALEVEDPLSAEVTLEEAIQEGYIPSPTPMAARKHINRANVAEPGSIESVGKRGNAKLYRVADLIEVFTSATTSTEESRKAS